MGALNGCTTNGILSEVYAALTWVGAQPQHPPEEAANAIRLLIEPPSALYVLPDSREASLKMLELAKKYHLTARRVHDARHAAMAIVCGIHYVYTYDVEDWRVFRPEGLTITGPDSVLGKTQ
jgi:predicted nucleic acid-binding protein